MLLNDAKEFDPKSNIICQMAEPDSVYMKALECFEHRTAMAMIDHDLLVPYPTYVQGIGILIKLCLKLTQLLPSTVYLPI